MPIFFGVGGQAKNVPNLYIGIGGAAKKVKAGWIGIGGAAKLFYSGSVNVIGNLGTGHFGYRRWDSDDRDWYYNCDTNLGGAPSYGQVSGNTLTVSARYYGGDQHFGQASKVGQVDFTGKTAIRVTYKVNSNGSDGNTGKVILLYGTAQPTGGTRTANMKRGYTQIGSGTTINSSKVGQTITETYNISLSGTKFLMVLLEGIPGTVNRDQGSSAASVTIQSVELL